MELPPFEIETNLPRKLMRFTLHGFWDLGTVDRFARASRDAGQRFFAEGCPPDEVLVLIDQRDQPAQSKEVVAAMQQLTGQNSGRARRSAVLVSGTLSKMQSGRIVLAGTTRLFTSEGEALDWLTSGADD